MDVQLLAAENALLWPSLVMGGAVLILAGLLAWLNQPNQGPSSGALADDSQTFFARQHRRRQRLNRLIALVGICFLIAPLMHHPVLGLLWWLGIAVLLLVVAVVAMWDFGAAWLFIQTLRSHQQATRMAMESRLEKLKQRPDQGEDQAR